MNVFMSRWLRLSSSSQELWLVAVVVSQGQGQSGKGPCIAGVALRRTLLERIKIRKDRGRAQGKQSNWANLRDLGWDDMEKVPGWGRFYVMLSEGWEDNLDGDSKKPVGTDRLSSSFGNKEKKRSKVISRGTISRGTLGILLKSG